MYSRESANSQRIIAQVSLACSSVSSCLPVHPEPFAKFASRWDLLPGRVVIPGSAGVPPAQDLAGSWRLASQGWSVHLPTGAGAAPLQECGRDARAPRGKPMAGQVQIRILQKALLSIHFFINIDAQDFSGNCRLLFLSIRKSARDHRRSQLLVQQRPVLVILCILCIDVQFLVLLD